MAFVSETRIGPLVIAHRGASGYLPEHTLAAKSLAYGLGADFLEQDIVATRDDRLVVLHDVHIDQVSDAAERFPQRARDDGRWYARDFDLAELRTLKLYERMTPDRDRAVFPDRFPHRQGAFGIVTFAEEMELLQGLNQSTGRQVGLYPEIKRPAWHHAEGVDLASLVLAELEQFGYGRRADAVYLQCFDALETRRLRDELGTELRIVQLIGENAWGEATTDYDAMRTDAGLAQVAEYADAVGPWMEQLYLLPNPDAGPVTSGMAEAAHDNGLAVHPYTFRADALANGFTDYAAMVRWFAETLAVDGLFTDFPDLTRAALGYN